MDMKFNGCEIEGGQEGFKADDMEVADVLISMSPVLEVHARFKNTLYVYFLGNKVAFSIMEPYLLSSWKKYGITQVMGDKQSFIFIRFSFMDGLEGVLEHGRWLIRNVPFILRT
nr:hypothetical protein [Tanacetum cinerariifolium]